MKFDKFIDIEPTQIIRKEAGGSKVAEINTVAMQTEHDHLIIRNSITKKINPNSYILHEEEHARQEIENEVQVLKYLNNKGNHYVPKLLSEKRNTESNDIEEYSVQSITGIRGNNIDAEDSIDTALFIALLYTKAIHSILNDGILVDETDPDDYILTTTPEGKPQKVYIIDLGKSTVLANDKETKKAERLLVERLTGIYSCIIGYSSEYKVSDPVQLKKIQKMRTIVESMAHTPGQYSISDIESILKELCDTRNIKALGYPAEKLVVNDPDDIFEKQFDAPLDPGARISTLQ